MLTKPLFDAAFRRTRCIIPASGYYEWHRTRTGRQPYYFTAASGQPLSIAGLWDEWQNRETSEKIKSCTMIITGANEFVGQDHDRMPALLKPYQFDDWLSGRAGLDLLKSPPDVALRRWPVSRRLNGARVKDTDPSLTAVDGGLATSEEILAAMMALVEDLGRFNHRVRHDPLVHGGRKPSVR